MNSLYFQGLQKDSKVSSFLKPLALVGCWGMILCVLICVLQPLLSFTDCGSCYVINMASVIGIIASDIILTIFIAVSVFCFATHHKRRREWDSHDGED